MLIIEDDPYWYLQYPSANALSVAARGKPVSLNHPANHNDNAGRKSSGYPFLDSLVPSYLHIDTRVIRLDTFSKTVAPRFHPGWITAQPEFVDRLLRITKTPTQQPSGFIQSMIAELIISPQSGKDGGNEGNKDGSRWKTDGWVRQLGGLHDNYERKMQKMSSIPEEEKHALHSSNRRPASSFSSDEDEEYQMASKTRMYVFVYSLAGMFL
jgi:DNA-binding transcriptional MocR family regulator